MRSDSFLYLSSILYSTFVMRFIKSFGFLLIIVALQSCMNDKPGYWKNDQISSGKRSNFHELNNQLLASLKANDLKQLEFIESKELLANSYMPRQVDLMSNGLKKENYILLDEYYLINKYKRLDTIKELSKGVNSHKLLYNGTTREMYLAFFVSETAKNKWMITATYCKFDYGWKLNDIEYNMYTANGKTAPELFEQAKKKYLKNYLVDATNDMQLASSVLRPNEMWIYTNEDDISLFASRLIAEANGKYKFPLVLQQVPTHPRIFRVFNQELNGAYYPQIDYQSSIKLADTDALKKENENVKKAIGEVFPGLDKDRTHILYSIFNEMPSSNKSVDRFDINDKLQ
jgi:hypothetical protein